jgi:hypothetical protein
MVITSPGGFVPSPRLRRRIGTGWRVALLAALLAAPSAASAACGDTPSRTAQPTSMLDQADDDLSPADLAAILAQAATRLRDSVVAMAAVWERPYELRDDSGFIPVAEDWNFSEWPTAGTGATSGGCADAPDARRPAHVDSVFSFARTSWRNEDVRDVQLEPLLSLEEETRLHRALSSDASPP